MHMTFITTSLPLIQIVLSVLLIAGVLLQQTGAGVGGALGGTESSSFHTRRGFENFLFYFTILVAILFVVSAIISIVL